MSLKTAVWLWQVEAVPSLHEVLRGVRVTLDARFLVAQIVDHCVLLSEVYQVSGKTQLRRFATWSRKSGLRGPVRDDFLDRRSDLQGTVINVSSVEVSGLSFH